MTWKIFFVILAIIPLCLTLYSEIYNLEKLDYKMGYY